MHKSQNQIPNHLPSVMLVFHSTPFLLPSKKPRCRPSTNASFTFLPERMQWSGVLGAQRSCVVAASFFFCSFGGSNIPHDGAAWQFNEDLRGLLCPFAPFEFLCALDPRLRLLPCPNCCQLRAKCLHSLSLIRSLTSTTSIVHNDA
jgi:hypothetical protein